MKFNIYAGIEQEGFNLHTIECLEFDSVKTAKEFAKEFAYDLYSLNPIRDVLDIEFTEGVDEDTAFVLFHFDLINRTTYYVEEIVEINGEIIEIIKH